MNWLEKRIIGLDIDESCVVATELIKKQNRIYLGRYMVAAAIKELLQDNFLKEAKLVINLPTQLVLFRSFAITSSFLKSKSKTKDLMTFLARQNLPFKLQECFWSTFTLNSHLQLLAAKKDVVERYIAQVENLGLSPQAVTETSVSLYNAFIYNYPEVDKAMLLNIRTQASDLIVYENKRFWIYPISLGKLHIDQGQDALSRFSLEVQRIFNSHYIQNPLAEKTTRHFYLSGQGVSGELIASLKKVFGDFEISPSEPLRRLVSSQMSIPNPQALALSLGMGLTYLEGAGCVKVNLIRERIKIKQRKEILAFLKKTSFVFVIFACLLLLFWDFSIFMDLKNQLAINKNTQSQILDILPKVKVLKEEKEKIQKLKDFLKSRLDQQKLYLAALAKISESKPPFLIIKEFNAEIKDAKLEVFISGTGPSYAEINDFLSNLRKNKDIKDVKVVASTFPALEAKLEPIDFKLRFEIGEEGRKLPKATGKTVEPLSSLRF